MLQQTQVSRVLVKYPEFLHRFPTLRSLARTKQREVVIAWQGMGYNNRAVRLHRLSQIVVKDHGGKIPQAQDVLLSLPGIGRCTANALRSSAFKADAPVVDVNVRRFFSRVFWKTLSTGDLRKESEIWPKAETLLPKGRAYDWNQALMDIGATICTAHQPRCEACPVAVMCLSRTGMTRSRNKKTGRREPSLAGIPNRMYRGRVVETLRRLRGDETSRGIRVDDLSRTIHPRYADRNEAWLKRLLDSLVKDGLIKMRGNGSFKTGRVTLA